VHARDGSGKAPLHNSAYYGHQDVTRLLLSAGAKVMARDRKGRTTLDFAIGNRKSVVADLLREEVPLLGSRSLGKALRAIHRPRG
jgi:ankyrin repeat protein